MSGQDYRARDLASVWHPYSRINELEAEEFPIIVRGDGVYLFDADGKRYIDGISSWWACNLGHGHPRIVEAIKRQAVTLQHSMIGGMSHPSVIELAERLVDVCPDGLSKAFFASDGSSAVEAALKIAIQYWHNLGKPDKTRFASLQDGYHGDTLGAVSVGMVETFHKAYSPLLFPAFKAVSPYCRKCPEGKDAETCNIECFSSMEAILEEHSEQLAAIILEPLNQAAAGMRIYPSEYLAKLSTACRKHNVLLIADEIAMGYGRSGRMFACNHADITPDILCLGKAMAAGYLPISATVVTQDIYDSFRDTELQDRTFYHGHTFTGNPIACAAAVETLQVFDDERIIASMAPSVAALGEGLRVLSEMPGVSGARQIGMVGAVEMQKSRVANVCREARRRGVLLRPLGDVLYLWPPLTISQDQMRDLIGAVVEFIEVVSTTE